MLRLNRLLRRSRMGIASFSPFVHQIIRGSGPNPSASHLVHTQKSPAWMPQLAQLLKPPQGFADETRLCAVQDLLGHSTTMMDTHVLKVATCGTVSPLDALSSPAG